MNQVVIKKLLNGEGLRNLHPKPWPVQEGSEPQEERQRVAAAKLRGNGPSTWGCEVGRHIQKAGLGSLTGFNLNGKWKCQSLSSIWPFATPWTVAHQASLSMGFSRQEYWRIQVFQARIQEYIPFSMGSSWPRDRTQVSHTAGRFFTVWATREALKHREV